MIKILVLLSIISVFLTDVYVPNIICLLPVLILPVTLSYYTFTRLKKDYGMFIRVGITLIINALVFTVAVALDFILDHYVYMINPHAGGDGVVDVGKVASDLVDDFQFLLVIVLVTSMLTMIVINALKKKVNK